MESVKRRWRRQVVTTSPRARNCSTTPHRTKVFLVEALRYFNGSTERVMIDNTHVVVLRGTGRAMVPVPEMAAFAERFGFRFVAHELGDANRSARVERPLSA